VAVEQQNNTSHTRSLDIRHSRASALYRTGSEPWLE